MGAFWLAVLWVSAGGLGVAYAAAPAGTCPRGWFGIQALVTRVSPSTAAVYKRAADGSMAQLAPGSVLCRGETLVFKGNKGRVDLYEAGRAVSVDASQGSYRVKSGARAVLSAAAAYVNAALEASTQLAAPRSRPQPTGARGEDASGTRFAGQINPILSLRNLPRQFVTADARPVVGWHDGVGPYACQAVRSDDSVVWSESGLDTPRCEFKAAPDKATRLVVRDSRGQSTGWSIVSARWRDVPRPPWLPSDLSALSSADRAAWGIWIWQRGGPEWRLQALGILNAVTRREWVASYVLDGVLAETPPVTPE